MADDMEFERETLVRARAGDPNAAREAIALFVSGLDTRELSDELYVYVTERLMRVAQGADATIALGLVQANPVGKPSILLNEDAMRIAAIVELLSRDDRTVAKAIDIVLDKYPLSSDTVRRYRRLYPTFKTFDTDLLRHIAGDTLQIFREYLHSSD